MKTYSRIDRVRIGMSICGTLLCLLPLPVLLSGTGSPLNRAVSGAAGLAVIAIIGLTELRGGHYPIVLAPISAALAVLAGTGMDDPQAVSGLCIGTALALTMRGSHFSVLVRMLCMVPVVPLAVWLSTTPPIDGSPSDARAMITILLLVPNFAGLSYLLRRTLEMQADTIAREQFSGRLSGRLLAATTVEDVVAAMVSANVELNRLSPGLLTIEAARIAPGEPGEGGARVLNSHGDFDGRRPDLIPAQALRGLPDFNTEALLFPLPEGAEKLTELGLPRRKWHATVLEQTPDAPADLLLHGVRTGLGRQLLGLTPEEVEFLGNLKIMQAHWRSAWTRVQARADLLDASERDDVTGLPDSSATMRTIVEHVHSGGDDRAALILLELSGLDRIEAEQGLDALDAALQQLGHRVAGIVDGTGFVGRSGDSTFAVLLPGADSYDEVESLVDQLEDAVLEPVMLPAGATHLSVHVGVARTTEGGTAADLLERAVSKVGSASGAGAVAEPITPGSFA